MLHRPVPFRPVAAFEHVVNLEAGAGLFALQTGRAAFTPLAVELADTSFQAIRARKDAPLLALNSVDADVVDCRIPAANDGPRRDQLTKLQQLAAVLAKKDSLAFTATDALWALPFSRSDVQHRAREHIRGAAESAGRGECREAGEALAGLSGLGPGLTPAGDDFLLGVLAVCRRWPEKPAARKLGEALTHTLAPLLPQTTWLGAALLGCGLEGDFSPAVGDILTAEEGPALVRAVAAGVAFGHTSGSDTLGGILFMTNILTS